MKIGILLFTLLLCNNLTFATKVNASIFGYNATDATVAFQNAIYNSNTDSVIIDYVANGEWIIRPSTFFNLVNKTIIFEQNVKLIAMPGVYSDDNSDCLIRLKFCSNVKLLGNNTLFKMQKAEYTTGERRHGLSLFDSDNVEVKNLIIEDTGGDGIYIVGARPAKPYCENVLISNVICRNNRRQGMSIISVQNLIVEHCEFKNTNGTLPESGVDFEPDMANERLVNILFRKCSFTNNFGSGITLALLNLTPTSVPVSIKIEDCYLSQNHQPSNVYSATEILANSSETEGVNGVVEFNRCLVENSQWTAFFARKTANGYNIVFNDCVFRNVSQVQSQYNNPIWLETVTYNSGPKPDFGGVTFNNQLIEFNTNLSFLQLYASGSQDTLANVAGNITVINPTANLAPIYNDLTGQRNVTYTYNFLNSYPTTSVSVVPNYGPLYESACNLKSFYFERASNNISYPLAIHYTLSGTANMVTDYAFMPSFLILPVSKKLWSDTLKTIQDTILEADETINIATNVGTAYSVVSGNFSTIIKNATCLAALKIVYINELNPIKKWVEIYNPSNLVINLTDYWLANGNTTLQINSSNVISGSLLIEPNKYSVVSWPNIEMADGELGFFKGNPTNNNSVFCDYMQYGSAIHKYQLLATNAQVWDSPGVYLNIINLDTKSYSANASNIYNSGVNTVFSAYLIQKETPSLKNVICPQNILLTGKIMNAKYSSIGQLKVSGEIKNTSKVKFTSENSILLENILIIPSGTVMEAKIESCVNN